MQKVSRVGILGVGSVLTQNALARQCVCQLVCNLWQRAGTVATRVGWVLPSVEQRAQRLELMTIDALIFVAVHIQEDPVSLSSTEEDMGTQEEPGGTRV